MTDSKTGEKISLDFSKLSSNKNSTLSLGFLTKQTQNSYSDPTRIKNALENNDIAFLRGASDYFFTTNGIYGRLVRYASSLLTFDHMVYPIVAPGKKTTPKMEKDFYRALDILEMFNVKRAGREIAHSVIRKGVYYGYVRQNQDQLIMQDLPVEYCRVIRRYNGIDSVEFDVSYFDSQIQNVELRKSVLDTYPKEVQAGYRALALGKIQQDPTDRRAWIPLELGRGVKFSLSGSELPLFIQILPDILDLAEMKGIQKQKALQEIAKIVVQKMPLNDDYEPAFGTQETRVLHQNVVKMLDGTVGVDVVTTFADVDMLSVVDKSNNGSFDMVQGARNTVYSEAGVSEQLFATDGNLALEKSILSDESILFGLLEEIEQWLVRILNKNIAAKGYRFGITMPRITIFTAQKAVETYKGLAQVGFSKILPGILTGQSQLSILSAMQFENEVLELPEKMTPVQMSSTQSSGSASADKKSGRPQKPDDEKSEKTIANTVSAS